MTYSAHEYDVIVIGAGPAGLSAALAAVTSGAKTLLLEKMERPGMKILASGGGKCNFSNTLDPVRFMNAFGPKGRFMTDALRAGGHDWFCEFLESAGVPHYVKNNRFCFPKSEKAEDILNAFLFTAKRAGLHFRSSARVDSLWIEEKHICGVEMESQDEWACRSLVLAGGGNAMSVLGGSKDGLKLAQEAGHDLVPGLPAMAPLYLQEDLFKGLSGVSLPDASLCCGSGRQCVQTRGELLFTHDGLSGPAALDISGPAYRLYQAQGGSLLLHLNLLPQEFPGQPECAAWIDRLRKEAGKKFFRTSLAEKLPKSLANVLCDHAGIGDKLNSALNNGDRDRIASLVTHCELHLSQLCPMDKAMAMSGGVDLKGVNPKTMESRLVSGLYFAGEILDLTGPCGGFNIQFAVASGRLAGTAAAETALKI